MFHTSTPQHSKDVIMGSLQDCHGTVRVVFASVAMGMGIDCKKKDWNSQRKKENVSGKGRKKRNGRNQEKK